MSWQCVQYVLDNSKSKSGARCVLIAIAEEANADGTGAWPSHRRLAKRANLSRRNTQKAIEKLVDLGELIVGDQQGGNENTPADKRPNLYTVVMTGASLETPRTDDRGVEMNTTGRRNEHRGASFSTPRGVSSDALPTQDPPKPSLSQDEKEFSSGRSDDDQAEMRSAVIAGLEWDQKKFTKSASRQVDQAVTELLEADVDPARVRRATAAWKKLGRTVALSPSSLVKNWPALEPETEPDPGDEVYDRMATNVASPEEMAMEVATYIRFGGSDGLYVWSDWMSGLHYGKHGPVRPKPDDDDITGHPPGEECIDRCRPGSKPRQQMVSDGPGKPTTLRLESARETARRIGI